ncbi:hypothetical protein FSP39_005090 [Pinctada imbricata]|uniref:Uncharacterized protein n=1 Tax=Pinctada imbricata TaxID=66713 RepID=A0AA88Y7Q0_PINIB|nr:hypothetical protein FSP39_005090 [Pinctada imbricata]
MLFNIEFVCTAFLIWVCYLVFPAYLDETFDPLVLKRGYDQVVKGRYLGSVNKSRIGTARELSFLDCVEECLSRRRCQSVSYFRRSLFCHFDYSTGTVTELQTDRQDAIYTNVTTAIWHAGLITTCQDHTCVENQVCRRLPLGAIECALSDCGPVPLLVANADYELPDGIVIGSRVFYSCREGYSPNVSTREMFAYCRPNGNWSTPKFKCNIVYCGLPLRIEKAIADKSLYNFSYGMRSVYSCSTSYRMVIVHGAEGYIECAANGSWSTPNFRCELEVEDCDGVAATNPASLGVDGVYNITKNGQTKKVYCDMSGGNWTVIQKRKDTGAIPDLFCKTYADYESGFGNAVGDYWLGNSMLSLLTDSGDYEVIFKITLTGGSVEIGHFQTFVVLPGSQGYQLDITLPGSGPLNNKLSPYNGGEFHTNDQGSPSGCSTNFFGGNPSGGWWVSAISCELCFNCCLMNGKAKIQKGFNTNEIGVSSIIKIRKRRTVVS